MNVLGGIAVSIVMLTTSWACPLADAQVFDFLVLPAAIVAELAGWIESIYFDNFRSNLLADVLQNVLKLCKSIVHGFLSMTRLHELHVEVFETDDGILLAQIFGKLPMACIAPIGDTAVKSGKMLLRLATMIRTHLLARKLTIRTSDCVPGLTEEQRRFDIFIRILGYEHLAFESEIETDALTCTCFDFMIWQFADEIDVDVAKLVPFDCQCLDLAVNGTAHRITVFLLRDVDRAVFFIKSPACLLERIRLVLADFLEARRRSLALEF